MENPFKRLGFRQFIIKTVIFISIGLTISMFIALFFRYTLLFQQYLSIPSAFQLEKPNFRTILLNALFFGIIAFIILTYKKLLEIQSFKFKKYQYIFILLAAFFLIFQYIYKFLININTEFFLQTPIFWGGIKILINIFFVISLAVAVYGIFFIKYFIKNFKIEIVTFSLLSLGFFFIMKLFQNLWLIFSTFITKLLYVTFNLFYGDVTYVPFTQSSTMTEGGGPLLGINGFQAIIGKPCSGIDSLLLFTSLYTLIFCLDHKRLKKSLTILLFFIGAIGMFITNILRILLLFMVGAHISPTLAVGLFHTNVGWILFIAYFFVFWWIASQFLYKKELS